MSRFASLGKAMAMAAFVLALAPLALTGCAGSSSQSSSADASSASSESAEVSASSEAAASEEASASAEAASSESAEAVPEDQTIGAKKKTGTVTVPGTWIDVSELLDAEAVDEYNVVQFADPDTLYTSKALKSDAYSSSIRMQQISASYGDVVKEVVDNYKSDDKMYGEVTTENTTFNGHSATIVSCQLPKDNLTMTDIAIDKYNDGKSCVLITLQAMPGDVEEVLGYASSWKLVTD